MIHLARDGTQLGQFTPEQVSSMLAAGQLKPTDLCWKEGMSGWIPLSGLESSTGSLAAPAAQPAPEAVPASVYSPPRGEVSGSFHQPGHVPPGSIQALKETRPWILFLAILGIIGTAFMVFAGVTMLLMGGVMSSLAGAPAGMPAGMMAGMAFFYIILAALYLYPIIKLFKYSGAIKRLSHSGSATDLDDALRQQKSFWKFVGIIMIVMIIVYIIILGAVVVGGIGAGMSRPPTTVVPAPVASP